jgi:hypothetical protein
MKLNYLSSLEKAVVGLIVLIQILVPVFKDELFGRFIISDRFKGLSYYYRSIGYQELVENYKRLYAYFYMIEFLFFCFIMLVLFTASKYFQEKNIRSEFSNNEAILTEVSKSSKFNHLQFMLIICLIEFQFINDTLGIMWRMIVFWGTLFLVFIILGILSSKVTHRVDKRIRAYIKTGELELVEQDPDLEKLKNRRFNGFYRFMMSLLILTISVLGYFGYEQYQLNSEYKVLPETIYLNWDTKFSSDRTCTDFYGLSCNIRYSNIEKEILGQYRVDSIELSFTDENYNRVLKDVNYGIKIIHHISHEEVDTKAITIKHQDGKWFFSFKVLNSEPFEYIGVYFYDKETNERLDKQRSDLPDFKINLIKVEKGN